VKGARLVVIPGLGIETWAPAHGHFLRYSQKSNAQTEADSLREWRPEKQVQQQRQKQILRCAQDDKRCCDLRLEAEADSLWE
jgi:hypothetical protein